MAKITQAEESVNPSPPPAGSQSFFFKSDGLYSINSAGQVSGPFAAAVGFITGSYTLLDSRYLPSGTPIPPVVTGTYNIQFFMGNGSSVVPTGAVVGGYHYVEIPYASEIESWNLYSDATGSITVNVLKSTGAGFPPASPLAGLGQPKLTNQRKNSGLPTGTITLAAQDVLLVEVVSSATVKITDLSLRARKL